MVVYSRLEDTPREPTETTMPKSSNEIQPVESFATPIHGTVCLEKTAFPS